MAAVVSVGFVLNTLRAYFDDASFRLKVVSSTVAPAELSISARNSYSAPVFCTNTPAPLLPTVVPLGALPFSLMAPLFRYHTAASVPVRLLLPDGTTNKPKAPPFVDANVVDKAASVFQPPAANGVEAVLSGLLSIPRRTKVNGPEFFRKAFAA